MTWRIDLVGRVAFGTLCIGGMASLAIPVLVVAGIVGGIVFAIDGDPAKALAVWLLAWASAVFAAALFVAIAYAAWPLATDWITEWPGYATGWGLGGAGLALMAGLVFAAPIPLYVAVLAPLGATFLAGFAVAGVLAGVRVGMRDERERAATGDRR
ncbi:MAG: hypothetical protein U1B78_05900 [Dehalococcoidia bacterium]|nr:hypothetical protein [Dehalococcoidia bacterium]